MCEQQWKFRVQEIEQERLRKGLEYDGGQEGVKLDV
jgi:hypothetical protein